jgi:tetratricopeptide (TPR) repeat protein
MKTIDFSYFIERYLAGEMDEAEKEWFSKELEGNKDLRKEVDLRRSTDAVLQNQNILNLRSKLAAIERQRAEPSPEISGTRRRSGIRYAAAIALLLIAGSGILLLQPRSMTGSEIIEKYYSPYEAPSTTRSGAIVSFEDYNTALEYYKIGDFRKAAVYFSKVLDREPDNMGSALLNGISNYEIKNYPEAEGSFKKVIVDDNSYFVDHAQWYLGLCYVQTGETQKAKDQMSLVDKSNSIYSKKARKILRSLK